MRKNVYPEIKDYGFISDCHSTALVSISGSIDWCCMPRLDSGSCFGRILDWKKGGYCQLVPAERFQSARRYVEGTLVLETTFQTTDGEARLVDCFTMREGGAHRPHQQILRIIEGMKGSVQFVLTLVPSFDYGMTKAWIRRYKEIGYVALGGNDGLLISYDFLCEMPDRHSLSGSCSVKEGERKHLSILYRGPELLDDGLEDAPEIEELDRRLDETLAWWRSWSSRTNFKGPHTGPVQRSAMVLKGLSNAPTGAIAAAPTTSLPESWRGPRNWDYRYSWIRDSSFTVRSLAEVGHIKEADGFRRFIERTAAGSTDELQILFGVGGERLLYEHDIKELEGYRRIKPVRVGNAASVQLQLDMYGELLDLAWRWHEQGQSPDDDYWEFLVGLVNAAVENWKRPDHGIWEVRGKRRHFVFSKVMCWAALDRGVKLAEELGRKAPLRHWKRACQEVRRTIEQKGYGGRRRVFVQAFDRKVMDAALLLLPTVGFVDYDDERMVRTTDAVRLDLEEDGLLRRYPAGDDGLQGEEGVFLACSFWLVECLARQARLDEAHTVFNRALSTGNDLGLFSEEYDTDGRRMLGNYPQGLTHLSLIAAARALTEMEAKKKGKPESSKEK